MRTNRFYPKFLTGQRVIVLALVAFVAVAVSILLTRPASTAAPSPAEIAQAVNGPVRFERPSAMEYVAKANSCVVGGVVTFTEWHVGNKIVAVGDVDGDAVGDVDGDAVAYTTFGFKSDNGQVFTVSENGALSIDPGENLGLELRCNPTTMRTASSFGMVAVIYGGK